MDTPTAVQDYLNTLNDDRKDTILRLRQVVVDNLPAGFEETVAGGMLSYVVPLSLYPSGYRNNKKQPLPFVSIEPLKNHISLHHLGVYSYPDLLLWFVEEYATACKTKLDMGKSCIRFKKMDDIPYELLAELLRKITPEKWIEFYESAYKPKSKQGDR